ncbi:zinc ribbon domain-containing protein [Paenibacillus doosanensis]|uniref:Double zinc ribbon n=1 Tax=Paenibacillus konkukensis TaxID=2020716 RepID=A0ABY4RXY6_9BACL|nr:MULTISPECIES: zinc ribbon domain-containing protein [Paenibacillus]MCS7458941.1 zinc ribbon domain-containing protein [Paenibacillus doosanensis]UQZ86531.1 Double zinc ribbon [Paenibacillus konkukensis]
MSFFDKMKQGASEAAKKAQQTVEATRLRAHISAKEKEMEKAYALIGEAVYGAYASGNWKRPEKEVNAYCEHITYIRQDIQALEAKLKEAKNEKLCRCGRVVSRDVKFCSVCGFQFEDVVFVAEKETEEPIQVMCRACRSYNEVGAKFCGHCGVVL